MPHKFLEVLLVYQRYLTYFPVGFNCFLGENGSNWTEPIGENGDFNGGNCLKNFNLNNFELEVEKQSKIVKFQCKNGRKWVGKVSFLTSFFVSEHTVSRCVTVKSTNTCNTLCDVKSFDQLEQSLMFCVKNKFIKVISHIRLIL